jgi:hypothetical protein
MRVRPEALTDAQRLFSGYPDSAYVFYPTASAPVEVQVRAGAAREKIILGGASGLMRLGRTHPIKLSACTGWRGNQCVRLRKKPLCLLN